ncbi:MAG TPA: hypothetical protein VN945_13440 [Gemmatimonadales bacterium]|nr:hypothetical protein [Gemmatimonadales bacterium]
MNALLLVLLALQGPVDEGTLVVREDTLEIARETFRLTAVRTGAGVTRWKLAATIRYDRTRPVVVLDPIVELGPDSSPVTLEYTVADPREPLRILGQLTRGRFVVRLLGRRTERAREFPAPPPAAVVDDSVFALYLPVAWQGRPQPVTVTCVFPRAGRRELLTVQDLGVESTTLNRDPAALRHITVTGGENRVIHLWLAADGRLAKVEVPSRRLVAERAPAS